MHSQVGFLQELAPEAERLLERHLAAAKEWFPHEMVRWDRVAEADPAGPWDPATASAVLDDAARSALYVNLLTDDNLHYRDYKDIVAAALEVDPSGTVCAIYRQVRGFEMPGTGIADFQRHAMAIARAGIYDFHLHHDQVLVPVVLRQWGLESIEGLSPEAERARASTLRQMSRIRKAANRFVERRAEATSVSA